VGSQALVDPEARQLRRPALAAGYTSAIYGGDRPRTIFLGSIETVTVCPDRTAVRLPWRHSLLVNNCGSARIFHYSSVVNRQQLILS
jgi:hypothetical protein